MTLKQIIDRYEARQAVEPAPTITPLGEATLAARHFALTLRELTPEDREHLLAQVVVGAEAGTHGCGFSLLVSQSPVRDPDVA